jgi:hypothetical protein
MNGYVKTNQTSLPKDIRFKNAEHVLNSFLLGFTLSISLGSGLNLLKLPWDDIIKWVPENL